MNTQHDPPECLICDQAAYSRGLCRSHHAAYHRDRKKLKTKAEREKYDSTLVAAGLLLPADRPGRKPSVGGNIFSEIATRVAIDKEADQIIQEARQAIARIKKSKNGGATSRKKPKTG